jgi:hypothetical protein
MATSKVIRSPTEPESHPEWARPLSVSEDRFWLRWVTVLSLPSLIFVLLFILGFSADFANVLSIPGLGSVSLLGLLGASTIVVAFILTMFATLKAGVSRSTRRIMWILITLSLAGWVYVWISLSMLAELPPPMPL